MKFTLLTLYPDAIKPYLNTSIIGRAQKNGVAEIRIVNLRDFGLGKHKQVDDTPYGGGPGMILRADVIVPAIERFKVESRKSKVILLSPTGRQFDQSTATRYSKLGHLILVCGRFEGFDARINKFCDEVISTGPYVLAGGEIPALTIVEAVARLTPGVLGNDLSSVDESFAENSIEYPQYTKPSTFDKMDVPGILLSGHHSEIDNWREAQKKPLP